MNVKKLNVKREVGRVIRNAMISKPRFWDLSDKIECIAQAILDKLPELGFVKLKDVEIDRGELVNMLCSYIVEKNIRIYTMCSDKKEVVLDILLDLTKDIAKSKPIRVKEVRR